MKRVHYVALCGMLIALGLLMGYLEFLLPLPIGIPGIKLGLANLVTVVALYCFNRPAAAVVSISRIFLSSLLFGNFTAFCYSLAGGACSLLIMMVSKRYLDDRVCTVSMLGGITHNIAQLLVASLLFDNIVIAFYLPILIISGALTGFGIGLAVIPIVKVLKNRHLL